MCCSGEDILRSNIVNKGTIIMDGCYTIALKGQKIVLSSRYIFSNMVPLLKNR